MPVITLCKVREQDSLLVQGYVRQQTKSKSVIPVDVLGTFVRFYHIPPVFDPKDFGEESVTQRVSATAFEKVEEDGNYSFVFVDGTFAYGRIEARFRIIALSNCADVTIGIMEETEYHAQYVTHRKQAEQTPYTTTAGYCGYTGCITQRGETSMSELDEQQQAYTVGDVVTLSLDFRELTAKFLKNDLLVHKTDLEPDTRYKISVCVYSEDTVELM